MDNCVDIVDFNNNLWIIDIKNAVIGNSKIKEGEFVKIIGDANENNTFIAEQIHPWIGNKPK